MSEIITWDSLDAFEQLALELLLEGDESLLTPNAGGVYDGLIAKGLAGRNWNDAGAMYFALTDAGLKVIPATPAPTDDLAALQVELEAARKEIDRLTRENKQLLAAAE